MMLGMRRMVEVLMDPETPRALVLSMSQAKILQYFADREGSPSLELFVRKALDDESVSVHIYTPEDFDA